MGEIMNLADRVVQVAREKGVIHLLKRSQRLKGVYHYLYHRSPISLGIFELPLAVFTIKNRRFARLDDALDFAFMFEVFGLNIVPWQVREEIEELLSILSSIKPKYLLEIGTANGGTLFLFCRVASPDAILISVDLPGGFFGGGYPLWRVPLYKAFARGNQKLYLLRADSHNPRTLETVKRILDGRKLDFLFIDGDHTYEGVKKDFEMYGPLVRKGGIIAFHDIAPHKYDPHVGVPKFWEEIKYRYKYLEIVNDWEQGWAGIGVLYV